MVSEAGSRRVVESLCGDISSFGRLCVTGLDKQPSTLRVATFIPCIGPDALEILTGLPFQSDDDRQNIDKVLELWQGKTNVIYERYRFNNRSQESDESIDAYTTALRTFAETCEHPSVTDPVESLSPPGFWKNRHWVGQFPPESAYFWLSFSKGLFH